MKFTQRTRGIFKTIAVVLSLALPVVIAASYADARVGGSSNSGSRGSRTFSAPPSTTTAPGTTQPMNRTMTQPGSPSAPAATGGGFFNRPGMGMLGGLAAGFLGAGLLGMLFGGGLFSGLGSFASILGLILQVGLIILVVRLAMSWWQRRNAPAYASTGMGPAPAQNPQANYRSGMGFGLGSSAPALEIKPEDYEAFERLLGEIQTAYGREDLAALRSRVTPEMLSYYAEELSENASRGVVNEISDVKLLQGDLAEAWREGDREYATVAMRYSLRDRYVDRATGRAADGNEAPQEATELWTFTRAAGGSWLLSAIQQTQ